jgi:hypothetical protein
MLSYQVNNTSSSVIIREEPEHVPPPADYYGGLLKSAGGFGKYQAIVSMILVLGYTMMGKVIYGLVFLLLLPKYTVDTTDGVCGKQDSIDWSNR